MSRSFFRSVPVPGDQVRIGVRGISRVTAGGRIGILLQTLLDISSDETLLVEKRLLIVGLFGKNRYNQEKVFYYLLMKYRYEHLENYPGNEPARPKQLSLQRKPSDKCGTARNQQQYHHRKSSLASQDGHRPQTRGKNYATGSNECARERYHTGGSHVQPQIDRSGTPRGRYAHIQDPQHQQSKPRLKAVASRSSLTASVRYGNRSGARRCHRSKSSLVSYMSNSPSTYRSVKPSKSYKRRISFKYQNSRNARGDKPKLTAHGDANKGVWDDTGYLQDIDREDSPKFEKPEAALPPGRRRGYVSIANRRSTVVIDGLVIDGDCSGAARSLRGTSFTRENEDAERRRIASKELEEVCEKAFNGSGMGSSLTTLSTVKSIGYTADESTNTIDASTFSHGIACSSSSNPQTLNRSRYTSSLGSTRNNLPSDTPIRKCSDDMNTLRIFQDEENDPDKGCLDDVIEHLDRLMDSSSKLRTIDQLRAVSLGGMPLNLGRSPLDLGDTPATVKQYLDQEERDHQRYLVARTALRNVSTPNPHRSPTMNHRDHQNKQPIATNTTFGPAPLKIWTKSTLSSPIDETPRSKIRDTTRAVDEALRFDAPMPTPELRLPVDQCEVQNNRSRVASGDDRKTKSVGVSELVKAVNEPRKKRSFMDIFSGKKNAKTDKNKDKSGDEKNLKVLGTPGTLGTFTHPSVDVLDVEKGTLGRRSGNVLRRFVSRDTKRELGLANDAGGESAFGNGSNMALNSMLGELFHCLAICLIMFY